MPRNQEKSTSKNIERLYHEFPDKPRAQIIAIGESESRRAGGDAPPAPKKKASTLGGYLDGFKKK